MNIKFGLQIRPHYHRCHMSVCIYSYYDLIVYDLIVVFIYLFF